MDRQSDFLQQFLRAEVEIRAFLGSVVRDVQSREDLFQEIALTLWQQFDRFDRQRSFAAWARGIAAKKLMERWNQARRTPVPFSPEAIQVLAEAAERSQSSPGLRLEALAHCLERVPEKSRRLLALRYTEGRPLETIAAHYHSTAAAIYQALSRLRRRLRECMERWWATEGGA